MADNYSMYNFNDLVHLDGDLTERGRRSGRARLCTCGDY